MGIKVRNGRFQADVYHNGQRLRKSFDTKYDAEAWLATARQALLKGKSVPVDPRLVPCTSRVRNTLEIRSKTTNKNLLFYFHVNWYRDRFDKIRNILDLKDVVWHTLRHTCASRLVQGRVPLTHVKEWMGHKTITTTMRYAHLAPKHLQVGIDVLEQNQ